MRRQAIKLVHLILKVSRHWVRLLSKLLAALEPAFEPMEHNRCVVNSTLHHDMIDHADEHYFAEQYWSYISIHLEAQHIPKNGRFLDLGCGSGRLIDPLAKWVDGAAITGVDLSESAITRAKVNLAQEGSVDFLRKDISEYLDSVENDSIDGIFFLEVSFFLPDYEDVLANINRVLKPNGLLFASFRSRYFNALCCVQDALWNSTSLLLDNRSGNLFGTATFFNWCDSDELRRLLTEKLPFIVHDIRGIGCCSGISGDPHAKIIRPSMLEKYEQSQLMRLEAELGKVVPDAGRYVFAVAEKLSKNH